MLEELAPDLLIADQLSYAGAALADRMRVPRVTLSAALPKAA